MQASSIGAFETHPMILDSLEHFSRTLRPLPTYGAGIFLYPGRREQNKDNGEAADKRKRLAH